MLRDPISKTIYAVQGSNSVLMQRFNNERKDTPRRSVTRDENYPNYAKQYGFYPWDEIMRTTSDVTSLSYLPATGALAVPS
jgi:hypothetical protein